jgi:hypothetical protein
MLQHLAQGEACGMRHPAAGCDLRFTFPAALLLEVGKDEFVQCMDRLERPVRRRLFLQSEPLVRADRTWDSAGIRAVRLVFLIVILRRRVAVGFGRDIRGGSVATHGALG